ncbi:hypothetical protein ACE38V_13420 [Cytobacillus sp. Hz8]|uniref:hypothetical protein n=1 Tax=Cytobacillus sp. Hz8 TaxID=3347168 RepID=UPI0035DFAA5D
MFHKLWAAANIILLFGSIIFIWIFQPHINTLTVISQFLAQIAIILFIVNLNMYFLFLLIRKTKQRTMKIRLATFSRYLMKWHIKIAISSALLIAGHVIINFMKLGRIIGYDHIKMMMGYMAFILLQVTLIAGYLRHKKASGFRKEFHRVTAMVFTVIFLIHLLIPL